MPLVPINRNGPCPCGSGLKFKKCCGNVIGRDAQGGMVSVGSLMREAILHLRQGQLEPAVRALSTIVEHEPNHQDSLFLLGRARTDLGRLDEAEELFDRAARISPPRADIWAHLATVRLENGKPEEAREAARTALKLDPKHALALDAIAVSYERLHDLDKALVAIDKLIEVHPKDPLPVVTWARIQRRRGELDAVRERLEGLLGKSLAPDVEARAAKELGQTYDKQGDYGKAFENFQRAGSANARRPHAARIDPHLLLRRIDDYTRELTPELLGRTKPADLGDGTPPSVHLVGFARSGTTMLEQVLAAHPNVVTSDEKPLLRVVRIALGRMFPNERSVTKMLASLTHDQILSLRKMYWEEVQKRLSPPAGAIVVDKNPMDLVELGIINVILPEARVIVALRDPRDVCISCFSQSFALNEAMIHFLSLDRTARLYNDMMGFWKRFKEITTLNWIEVRYEDATANLEREARRMLEHIGVDWDPAVLAFHEKARLRPISTPSSAAVTEPIHARAVARWKNYGEHLEKVQARLEPWIREFGYPE